MKKIKTNAIDGKNPLRIARETLANLSHDLLPRVVGGMLPRTEQTYCACK